MDEILLLDVSRNVVGSDLYDYCINVAHLG